MAPGESSSGHDTSPILSPKTAPSSTPIAAEDGGSPTSSGGSSNETPKMQHDSMVTVRLSEPPALTLDTSVGDEDALGKRSTIEMEDGAHSRYTSGESSVRASSLSIGNARTNRSLQDELEDDSSPGGDSGAADEQDDVNWERLEKTEDEQPKDEETDNSTALLLARLEQENAKLATNPKSVQVQVTKQGHPKARPPSMAQLREMVNGPTPSALRYSMLPAPPMTDLEFWAALVKDYQQTAARLPTLLSNKIHKGIPPPLRGVVWQSMSGARDGALEEQYDRYSGESSPYEFLIGKDLGRSFPGVDMFRDPEGDGQRMLGRVLKAFSLYDTKIGYCQGLAFLVGPLLMHMPDKQAFCVLVKLMERYDLRTCFLPDLSGLHVRIYQFRELLRSNLPSLSAHFEELQVDPAYVSQWFLSFFAVTCPLPMLFRIYDVIFAEGASETLMRVALSLMRKNEVRLMNCTELEDVMQLLLSRGLWDCYHYDADEFVNDFVSLTGEVSKENLSQLERGYRDSLVVAANATRASDITTAATRFLGRIWASTSSSAKPSTLAPTAGAQSRPLSILQRSTSKQSLASFLTNEASSASVTSSTSTEATTVSRDSSNTEEESSSRESTPVGTKSIMSIRTIDDRHLHSQIEDLLTALSELQRNHTLLTDQLQREREEREEDKKAVLPLIKMLKGLDGSTLETIGISPDRLAAGNEAGEEDSHNRRSSSDEEAPESQAQRQSSDEKPFPELVERVEERFTTGDKKHRSSMMQSKVQLREELTHLRDQLASAMSQTQEFDRRIHDLTQEVAATKEQLRESHIHVRTLHQEKHRLEKMVQGMRSRTVSSNGDMGSRDHDSELNAKGNAGGLREFKLGRSKSTPSQAGGFVKRLSSLPTQPGHESAVSVNSIAAVPSAESAPPAPNENEALLIELVQSKTAEAVARQEAEEAKQKLEALRKAYNLAVGDGGSATNPAGNAAMAAMGVFGRLTGQASPQPAELQNAKATNSTSSGTATNSGGFWGWRR